MRSPASGGGLSRSLARRRLTWLLTMTVCSLAMFAAGAAAADACTSTWSGGGQDGQWATAANWSGTPYPGANNAQCDVVLPASSTPYTVTLTPFADPVPNVGNEEYGSFSIPTLTVGAGATLVIEGESYVKAGDGYQTTELSVTGGGSISSGATVELQATDNGPVTPENGHGGNAELDGSSTITNSGSFISASTTTQATAASNAFHNLLGVNLTGASGSTGELTSGYLDIGGGVTVTNQGTWTVDPGATETVTHNGLQTGSTTFVNNGTYANNGATQMTELGMSNETPDIFTQNGPETGHAVLISRNGELNDMSGAGSFLINDQQATLAGTIPAGQTVTVQGDLYNTNTFTLELRLSGSQVINNGTLIFNAPNVSTDSYPDTETMGAPLVNDGTLDFVVAAPALTHQLDVSVTNQPGATINVESGQTLLTNGATDTNNGTLTVAPGANLDINANPFLTGSTTFTNGGTIVPELAAGATGTLTFDHNTNINLGGSVAPQLVGGYVPAAGTEVQAFPVSTSSVKLTGTFAAVTGGFTADYTHDTGSTPNYIGLVYGPATAAPTPAPPTHTIKAPTIGKPSAKGAVLSIKLSCATGKACTKTKITETVIQKVKAKQSKKAKTRSVVVATATVALAAGKSKAVNVTLNKTGKRLLTSARSHHLKVTVTVAVGGKTKKTSKITLSAPTPKRARGKQHKHG